MSSLALKEMSSRIHDLVEIGPSLSLTHYGLVALYIDIDLG